MTDPRSNTPTSPAITQGEAPIDARPSDFDPIPAMPTDQASRIDSSTIQGLQGDAPAVKAIRYTYKDGPIPTGVYIAFRHMRRVPSPAHEPAYTPRYYLHGAHGTVAIAERQMRSILEDAERVPVQGLALMAYTEAEHGSGDFCAVARYIEGQMEAGA